MATTRQSTGHGVSLPEEVETCFSSQCPVPATHRHAIRQILARLDDSATYDEATMYATPSETRLRLYDAHAFSTYDIRRALQGYEIDWELSVFSDSRYRTVVRLTS